MSTIKLKKYKIPVFAVLGLWWAFYLILLITALISTDYLPAVKMIGPIGYAVSQIVSVFFIGAGIRVLYVLNRSSSIRNGSKRVLQINIQYEVDRFYLVPQNDYYGTHYCNWFAYQFYYNNFPKYICLLERSNYVQEISRNFTK